MTNSIERRNRSFYGNLGVKSHQEEAHSCPDLLAAVMHFGAGACWTPVAVVQGRYPLVCCSLFNGMRKRMTSKVGDTMLHEFT